MIILSYGLIFWWTFFLVVMTELHHTERCKGYSTSLFGQILLCIVPPVGWYFVARYWAKELIERIVK